MDYKAKLDSIYNKYCKKLKTPNNDNGLKNISFKLEQSGILLNEISNEMQTELNIIIKDVDSSEVDIIGDYATNLISEFSKKALDA